MRIISYNINGIRAALNKGLADWLKTGNFDVVCFQEIKANPDQFDTGIFEALGYHHYWFPAQKKGYSGTAILSKTKPNNVVYGSGIEEYDNEGRSIRLDFDKLSVMNNYFPSGSSGDERQAFKMVFLDKMFDYFSQLKKAQNNLVICGDYNICHRPIDIHDPVRNADTSGFKPEEREWMSKFFDSGFIDTFRKVNGDIKDEYSWWSYRAGARRNNKGWRIDYIAVSEALEDNIKNASILQKVEHSDHCPVYLELAL